MWSTSTSTQTGDHPEHVEDQAALGRAGAHGDGVPWGFLDPVNGDTKWSGTNRDQTLALAHPQALTGSFTAAG